MRKIIGGEFKIPFVKFNSFFSTKNYFSSGRAALFGVLSNINKEETKGIQLPNYLCSSITQTIIDFGLNYTFYKIDKDTLLPNEQEILNKSKKFPIILLINYFGLVSNDLIIENLKKHNLIVILDNVQNYYGDRKSVV